MLHLFENIKFSFSCIRLERVDRHWRTELFRKEFVIIPYSRLYFPVEGEAFGEFGDVKLHFRPGFIYMLPPYVKAKVWCPHSMLKYWTHFNAHIQGTLLDIFNVGRCEYEMPVADPTLFTEMFKVLIRIQSPYYFMKYPPSGVDKLEADAAITLLLAPFFRNILASASNPATCDQRILEVLLYIEQHISERIELTTLAGITKLNPTYLSNLFAAKMGVPLIRYINGRRVADAVCMLRDKTLSIKEIADRLGAENPLVFSRLFKRHTGRTPVEYRKHLLPDDK
ncbi:MAG: Arabinose operon regulatory protein [Lentisphaerae bacterium ADurb.Bin242]|nr:MAG: Arabinose operon regulatory protein [Lentisphaerae bacterium ADurb.Bin242]